MWAASLCYLLVSHPFFPVFCCWCCSYLPVGPQCTYVISPVASASAVSICSASLYAYLMTCPQPPFWFILSSSAEVWMRRLVLAFCLLSVRQGQLQMVISAAVHTLFSFGCIFVPWPKSCFLAFHKHSFAHCGIEALPKLTFPSVDCHLGAQAKCLGTHFFISVQKL